MNYVSLKCEYFMALLYIRVDNLLASVNGVQHFSTEIIPDRPAALNTRANILLYLLYEYKYDCFQLRDLLFLCYAEVR